MSRIRSCPGGPSTSSTNSWSSCPRTAAGGERYDRTVPWWAWLLVSLAVVVLIWEAFVGWLVLRGRRDDARAFATFIPDCVVLLLRLAREPRVPRRRKLLLLVAVAYLALPFELVPDFIPVAGHLDDVIIVAFVLRYFIRAGGPHPVEGDIGGGGTRPIGRLPLPASERCAPCFFVERVEVGHMTVAEALGRVAEIAAETEHLGDAPASAIGQAR